MMMFWKTKIYSTVTKNDGKYVDMQQLLTQACTAVINSWSNESWLYCKKKKKKRKKKFKNGKITSDLYLELLSSVSEFP